MAVGQKQGREAAVKNRRFCELLLTTDILSRRLSQTLKKEELSGTQYTCSGFCAERRPGWRAAKSATG